MFGFIHISIWGIIYLCLLFIPNMIWNYHKPIGYDSSNEDRFLLLIERVGEVLTTCFAVIQFRSVRFQFDLVIMLSILCMFLYECYWIRYFSSPKTLEDFYKPFLKIPVPGAFLPVVGMFLLGIYQQHYLLIGSSVILGIGHVGIHLQHLREIS